jgi:hypothetical protein
LRVSRARELEWIAIALFVALAFGGAAGPHPFDVGELAAAAAQLGGSHAPGQPLHALLGHAASWLPLGTWIARLSWLSAIGAAVAAYACGRCVLTLAEREEKDARMLACTAAIAVALVPAVLRNAMRPEVYTLALACVMLAAWALAERARGWRPGLRVAAIVAGLAFALHPPHALAIAAIAGVACIDRRPTARDLIASLVIGLVITSASIAYLPIRASAGAPCWGEPTTAAGLWAYVSGAAYRHNLGAGSRDVLAALRYAAIDGGGVAIALLPIALRDRSMRAAWGMAIVAVIAAVLQPLEERNPDNVAYHAPAIALCIVAAASSLARVSWRVSVRSAAAIALPIGPLAASLIGHHLTNADLPALETLAFESASSPAPRALVLSRTDFVAAAMMQSASVDRLRPDVAHFVEGLATSSWHWRSLSAHPAFDGAPHRGTGSDAHEAYVHGAIDRARGVVEIDAENATRFADHGIVRGVFIVRDIDALHDGVADRSTAERTMVALASTLSWAPLGDHEAGAQIVRDVVIRRASLLIDRDHIVQARRELAAAEPIASEEAQAIDASLTGEHRAALVHDRDAFLASRGDVVREIALLLAPAGHMALATDLLRAQQARGDDLSVLQLAAIELAHGDLAVARATRDAYRSTHPDARSPDLDALDAALGGSR